jgi:hypothetical protein
VCLTCATPVRGKLVCPTCLPGILEDVPAPHPLPPAVPRRGHLVAALGFAAVVLLSVPPWSRGALSGLLGAWAGNWSLPSVTAAAAGVVVAAVSWRRGWDPGLTALGCAALALAAGGSVVLFLLHPPVLAEPSRVPGAALAASGVALAGAGILGRDALVARRGE